ESLPIPIVSRNRVVVGKILKRLLSVLKIKTIRAFSAYLTGRNRPITTTCTLMDGIIRCGREPYLLQVSEIFQNNVAELLVIWTKHTLRQMELLPTSLLLP